MHFKVRILALIGILFGSAEVQAASLKTGDAIFPPIGFIKFCTRNKAECLGESGKAALSEKIDMDHAVWQILSDVQKQVNTSLIPAHDRDVHGVLDNWSMAELGYGDCEDYALLKRRLLLDKGLPASALLLTTAITEQGERHVVLTAVTSMGDIVLDNRFEQPRFLDSLDYHWLARQDPVHRLRWRAAAEQPNKSLAQTINPFASYAAQ